jgi:pilus assembly protein CpaC
MMRKKLSFILAVLVILVFSASATAAIPVEVTVGKGTIVSLKKTSERVSISDPAVADMILISPTEILLNGKKIGSTTLIVWDKEGKRTFFDVFVVGDVGELIEQIKALAPDADITVELARDAVVLKGNLKNEETVKKILTISQAYAPKVINFLRVEEAQQVVLEVKVAQIDRNKLKELGVSVLVKGSDAEGTGPGFVASPDGILGGETPGFDVIPGIEGFDLEDLVPQIGVAHFPSGVTVFLRALASKGLAKVLAEPNLVVRSGEEGEFLAGSRIPIQTVSGTVGQQTVDIIFEEVGVKINFAPEVLETGVIRLKIDPAEVSNVIQFISFQGVLAPEIATRQVSTSVDLREEESLILAGLLDENMRKNIDKVPILGDIPILGAFFRSTRDEIETTELAFFITPKLVKPLPPGERPELPGEKPLTPEEEAEFQWIPIPRGKGTGEGGGG